MKIYQEDLSKRYYASSYEDAKRFADSYGLNADKTGMGCRIRIRLRADGGFHVAIKLPKDKP